MPDLTMCCNEWCTLKADCYRYKATPDELNQSWFLFEPVQHADGDFCENKIPMTDGKVAPDVLAAHVGAYAEEE